MLAISQRLGAQLRDLGRLRQHRAAHVREHGLEILFALAQKRIQEAGRTGVVDDSLPAPPEQSSMLEEHVHQLPEHVVERLHELLRHEGVLLRGRQLPLRADA